LSSEFFSLNDDLSTAGRKYTQRILKPWSNLLVFVSLDSQSSPDSPYIKTSARAPIKMGRKTNQMNTIIVNALLALHKVESFNNRWICPDILIQLLYKTNLLPEIITCEQFNRVIKRRITDIDDTTHSTQFITRRHKMNDEGIRCYGYYLKKDDNNETINDINWLTRCYTDFNKLVNDCIPPLTRRSSSSSLSSIHQLLQQTSPSSQQPSSEAQSVSITPSRETRGSRKRKLNSSTDEATTSFGLSRHRGDNSTAVRSSSHNRTNEGANRTSRTNKWHSPEALIHFLGRNRARSHDQSFHVQTHVETQILRLRLAYMTFDGWKTLIDSNDDDDFDFVSPKTIFKIQQKAKYISIFLSLCLSKYETETMMKISVATIQTIKQNDSMYNDCFQFIDPSTTKPTITITRPQTILDWFLHFKDNNDFFPIRINNKKQLPPLLDNNPDIVSCMKKYSKENLDTLSVESMQSFLHNTVLPETAKKIETVRRESENNDRITFTVDDLLKMNKLRKLHTSTVTRWMSLLGFKYEPRKKCYYVDTHEKPENVRYRMHFIKRYFQYELRSHRWCLVPEDDFKKMVEDKILVEDDGKQYIDEHLNTYFEVHVDTHDDLNKYHEHLPFGGQPSKFAPPNTSKPLIIFGQDESIFKQYSFSTSSWTCPDGTKQLIPKDDGTGLMLSSFISREFGYGMELTKDQLEIVNAYRKGKHYSDVDAAIMKLGSSSKTNLTESPFVRQLEYGARKEGYWKYESMVIQLEDIVDVLMALYPQYDYVFLFDHSNGHDRMQPDGLNANSVNKNYGGKQPKMHDTELTSDIILGPHRHFPGVLETGDIQTLIFPDDIVKGPFHLSESEREARRYDVDTGEFIEKNKTRDMLIADLHRVDPNIDTKGNVKKLQELCDIRQIPTKYQEKKIKEGWAGKPKGSLQILYERGFIDPNNWKDYNAEGKKDEYGILREDTSLNLLMKQQHDFMTELTLLQLHGEKLGVIIDRSPKCHPEIAGEGIEYVWSLAKLKYRFMRIHEKRSRMAFHRAVKESTCPRNHLTVQRIRKCSKRARRYMLAYSAFNIIDAEESGSSNSGNDDEDTMNNILTHKVIEKAIQTYKRHRTVDNIDPKWIKNLMLDVKEELLVQKVVKKMRELSNNT
jgi:hypothetical protein